VLATNKLHREEVVSLGDVYFADAQDGSGYTPLILASGMNFFDVVATLLDMNVDVNMANKFGHTAFTFACCGGHTRIAMLLLKRGANIFHKTGEGSYCHFHFDRINYQLSLIQTAPCFSVWFNLSVGRTGLHYACMYTKASTVKALVDYYIERLATERVSCVLSDEARGPRWAADADALEAFAEVGLHMIRCISFFLVARGVGLTYTIKMDAFIPCDYCYYYPSPHHTLDRNRTPYTVCMLQIFIFRRKIITGPCLKHSFLQPQRNSSSKYHHHLAQRWRLILPLVIERIARILLPQRQEHLGNRILLWMLMMISILHRPLILFPAFNYHQPQERLTLLLVFYHPRRMKTWLMKL
jgi:hypothetical protein